VDAARFLGAGLAGFATAFGGFRVGFSLLALALGVLRPGLVFALGACTVCVLPALGAATCASAELEDALGVDAFAGDVTAVSRRAAAEAGLASLGNQSSTAAATAVAEATSPAKTPSRARLEGSEAGGAVWVVAPISSSISSESATLTWGCGKGGGMRRGVVAVASTGAGVARMVRARGSTTSRGAGNGAGGGGGNVEGKGLSGHLAAASPARGTLGRGAPTRSLVGVLGVLGRRTEHGLLASGRWVMVGAPWVATGRSGFGWGAPSSGSGVTGNAASVPSPWGLELTQFCANWRRELLLGGRDVAASRHQSAVRAPERKRRTDRATTI
jgi:hypothetical protein